MVATDVTPSVLAKNYIAENEMRLRSFVESTFFLIGVYVGKEMQIQFVNQSMFNYSGLTPEQVEKNGWLQIVHPEDREENIQHWLHSITAGEPFLYEHRFRRHDGEYRWQLSRALPVKDSEGNIQMWVGTSTDIDEIKKHQQEKDDFIKIASHGLKTPVTTIKAYVQLLLNQGANASSEMLPKSLATIDKQITKLAKIISDLLIVTKIELGSFLRIRKIFPSQN